jgi:protein-disulfide isomerase
MIKPSGAVTPALILTLPTPRRDHIQGPVNAPIKLLEYGDYECPFCGRAYPIVKAIQKELGASLCFAFRNFPLSTMHPHAEHAARAAEAAGRQGRFWEMHDLLFENQNDLEDVALARYAELLGLDARRLVVEILSGAHSQRIREDFKGGIRGGVNGTPTFFINGVRYDGAHALDELIAALTRAAA